MDRQATTPTGWHAFLPAALITLNIITPAMAGLWLMTHGQILDVGMGLGFGLLLPIVWTMIATRPAERLLGHVRASKYGSNLRAVTGTAFAASAWQYAVLSAWTLGVFAICCRHPRPGDLPVLVAWGYGAVMAGMTALALHKLQPGSARTMAVWFAFGACAVSATGCLIGHVDEAVWALSTLTVAGALANAALVGRAMQTELRAKAGSHEAWTKPRGKRRAA